MLLMISNNNMSLRELYTLVLDNHPAGWVTSFMSGMPGGVESIVSGYDAVVYELGAADSSDRVSGAKALRAGRMPVITHVEGRQSMQRTQELQAAGVYVVANPVSGTHIAETVDAVVAALKTKEGTRHVGVRERFRRLLGG